MGALMADVRAGAVPGELLVRDGDQVTRVYAVAAGGTTWVFHDGVTYEIVEDAQTRSRGGAGPGSLTAPMPATVVHVKAAPGDIVKRGDILIVLEAMKMELPVRAPGDGRVTAVHCEAGQLVQPDTSLIEIGPLEPRGDAEPGRGVA
jgi:acetyl/propionyl-CoA carboxylase alpha subunit